MSDIHPTWFLVGSPLLSLLSLGGSLRALRKKRILQDTPTSKVQGVFIGQVEAKGTAESDAPRTSFLAGNRCVWYAWKVEERWSRVVTETDSKGRTRTRTQSGWETVAKGGESPPFFLKDDTGALRILPDGAAVEAAGVFDRSCGPGDPLYYGKGPPGAVAHSDHVRKFSESAIPLHAALFIAGRARERKDIAAAEIAADPAADLFLISTRSEEEVTKGHGRWGLGLGILAVALAAATVAAWRAARDEPVAPYAGDAALAGTGALGLWLLGWIVMAYNGLVGLRQRVRQAWSLVDVQLKRRHDLIPNLVEVVKGFRDHEQTVQVHVAAMRNQLQATPPGRPGPDPAGCLPAVRAIVERYPELKANENFVRLQTSLVDTEQRIALAREYFNHIATFYNTRIAQVPDTWLAGLGGLREQPLLAAAEFERAAVAVRLAD